MSVYSGNLSHKITQDNIYDIFSEYGTVIKVPIPTSRVRGFSLAKMEGDAQG